MKLEFLASVDEHDGRVEARCLVAGYMTVNDAFAGMAERDELDDGSYPDYGADEVYEFHTGESVPAGYYAEFHEGDLFLGMFEDCDPDDASSIAEAFHTLQETAAEAGHLVDWAVLPDVLVTK